SLLAPGILSDRGIVRTPAFGGIRGSGVALASCPARGDLTWSSRAWARGLRASDPACPQALVAWPSAWERPLASVPLPAWLRRLAWGPLPLPACWPPDVLLPVPLRLPDGLKPRGRVPT